MKVEYSPLEIKLRLRRIEQFTHNKEPLRILMIVVQGPALPINNSNDDHLTQIFLQWH